MGTVLDFIQGREIVVDERSRFARSVFPDGEEPDPRFTLANERTVLAWTRTSVAFLAGGIAFEAFQISGLSDTVRTTIAVFIIAVGMIIAAGAAVRWMNVERAMRKQKPLPVPAIIPFLSIAALVASAAVLVLIIVQ